jgi:APA family basic amino acid/polyamine antiporter
MSHAPHSAPVQELKGRLDVTSAVTTLVGYIIGGSIFILPGALAAEIGPAVFIAYLIAAALSLIVCVVSAQIGSAFPMSGGTYVAVSCVIGPFWGFMVVWMGTLIVFTSTPALAYGLVDYLTGFYPVVAEHRFAAAVLTIVVFTGVNLMGIRTTATVQTILVAIFMVVLLVVGIGGILHSRAEHFVPLFPDGLSPVLQAAIPAFYSYSGFSAIVTFGGEIDRPRRNIPLVLLISFPIIAGTYTLVTLATAGVVPWQELRSGDTTLTRISLTFLPSGIGVAIAIAALCAIATTISGLLLSKSRDLFSLALDRVLPKSLAQVGPFGEPRSALVVMCLVAILGVSLQRSFAEYASMAVLCVMVVHVLQGIVIIRLPNRLPAHFAAAGFRLSPLGRIAWGSGLVMCAIGFITVGLAADRVGAIVYLVACGIGAVWYVIRRRTLRERGIRLEELLLNHASHVIPASPPPPQAAPMPSPGT